MIISLVECSKTYYVFNISGVECSKSHCFFTFDLSNVQKPIGFLSFSHHQVCIKFSSDVMSRMLYSKTVKHLLCFQDFMLLLCKNHHVFNISSVECVKTYYALNISGHVHKHMFWKFRYIHRYMHIPTLSFGADLAACISCSAIGAHHGLG